MEIPAPPPGRLYADFFVRHQDYHVERRRGARDWLLSYTTAGRGCYRGDGVDVRCETGDVVLLPPDIPHDYKTDPAAVEWHFFWAHFSPLPGWQLWLDWATRSAFKPAHAVVAADQRERVQQAFARCVADSAEPGAYADALAHLSLAEVLVLIARQASQPQVNKPDPRIALVLQRIASDLDQPLNVAMLAREISLSPSRLAHLFKEQTGEPLIEARQKMRLRHAARLLTLGNDTIGEIAQASGFTLYQFSRQFKRWYGVSPSLFRQQQSGVA
jgi:AraC family transcriptional regulator, arabinose operon regulatory protein